MSPKVDFGMIVLNGDDFVDLVIRNVYDIANKIIIIEGAVKTADKNIKHYGKCTSCDEKGLSTDNTREKILSVPDPLNKIIYNRVGWVEDKVKLSQLYLDQSDADYMWQLDSDEMYEQWVMKDVIEYLETNKDINTVSFPVWHFIGDLKHIGSGKNSPWDFIPFRRIHRFKKGSKWTHHEPPCMTWPGEKKLVCDMGKNLDKEYCASRGWYMYHYSFVTRKQAVEKMDNFYHRIYKPNWVGRIFDNIFNEDVVKKYGSHSWDETILYNKFVERKGGIEKFLRQHPTIMKEHPLFIKDYPKNKNGSKQLDVIHMISLWCGGGGCRSPYLLASINNDNFGCVHEFIILSSIGPDEDFAGRSIYTPMNCDKSNCCDNDFNNNAIVEYVKRRNPDIIHVNWWAQDAHRYRKIRSKLLEYPFVMTIHSHPYEGGPYKFRREDSECYDAVMLASEKTLELQSIKDFQKSGKKVYVVHSPVNKWKFENVVRSPHFGFNVVLYGYKCSGRYRSNMFETCKKIIDKYKDVCINFIGLSDKDSEYGSAARQYNNDRMVYLGFIDVMDLLPAMDLNLHILPDIGCSTCEVFVQECALFRIPTLRIGGYNSVTDDLPGINVTDENQLLEQFDKIYNDAEYREKEIQKAYDKVIECFDPKKSAFEQRKVYLETIERFKK